MALHSCRECGREISDQAVACPHCGAPMRAGDARPTRVVVVRRGPGGCAIIVAIVVIGFLAVFVIGALKDNSRSGRGSQSTAAPEGGAPTNHWSVTGRQGQGVVLVAIDDAMASDRSAFAAVVANECPRQWCQALFWKRSDGAPAALPMSDAKVRTQLAAYNRNAATGLDRWRWRCDAFPDAGPDECFTPD